MKKVNDGMNYELVFIDSRKLEVLRDQYQKPLNKKRVAQIAANLDENIANEPKVNFRDGHYYVFDGQHTVAARVLRNGGKPLKIQCKVYRDLTKEQEAILFVKGSSTRQDLLRFSVGSIPSSSHGKSKRILSVPEKRIRIILHSVFQDCLKRTNCGIFGFTIFATPALQCF